MEFIHFKLLFAGLVIALAIVAWFIVRSVRQSRSAADPKAARSGPIADPPATPHPRRRQIGPALAEASALAEAGALAEEALAESQPETPQEAADPLPVVPSPDLHEQVLARLEEAFERYGNQEVSLEEYRALVLEQQAVVERRAGKLRSLAGNIAAEAELDAAETDLQAAADAVRWCLEWAAAREDGGPDA